MEEVNPCICYLLVNPKSIPEIFPILILLGIKSSGSNKIAAKYLSVLVLETVTDFILLLIVFGILDLTIPNLGSFKPLPLVVSFL
ncbi:hypothetical protein NO976_02938 [Planktothrix agardhii]|nr:hypothetical protein NO976_02938 [Planktothrix agardhii]